MNIFIVHPSQKESARWLFKHDKIRARKQILEGAQLLAHGCKRFNIAMIRTATGKKYSTTAHANHPCTKWVCEDITNFTWLIGYVHELCREYEKQSGKRHQCYWSVSHLFPYLSKRHVDNPFFGSEKYLANIQPEMTTYRKYQIYLANKWELQDKRAHVDPAVITFEMRDQFYENDYLCPPPPVPTYHWTADDWCHYITKHGSWGKQDKHMPFPWEAQDKANKM